MLVIVLFLLLFRTSCLDSLIHIAPYHCPSFCTHSTRRFRPWLVSLGFGLTTIRLVLVRLPVSFRFFMIPLLLVH